MENKDSAGQKRMNLIEAVRYLKEKPDMHFIRAIGWGKKCSVYLNSSNVFYIRIKGIGSIQYQFRTLDFEVEWVKL
ncbi:MAG: hypothetical protein PHN89_04455 [Candidatus Pacebacteria bacterium]|nr:hypothetical protein [Candidatus Paceibacterota bacterium]